MSASLKLLLLTALLFHARASFGAVVGNSWLLPKLGAALEGCHAHAEWAWDDCTTSDMIMHVDSVAAATESGLYFTEQRANVVLNVTGKIRMDVMGMTMRNGACLRDKSPATVKRNMRKRS
ncbi:hypothetical protein BU17DRAFT_81312 [Hysterangium stoloniferum]|nr:hypothetical protein BU17DRAFT_81312 [Hysterangium stoloniferum]